MTPTDAERRKLANKNSNAARTRRRQEEKLKQDAVLREHLEKTASGGPHAEHTQVGAPVPSSTRPVEVPHPQTGRLGKDDAGKRRKKRSRGDVRLAPDLVARARQVFATACKNLEPIAKEGNISVMSLFRNLLGVGAGPNHGWNLFQQFYKLTAGTCLCAQFAIALAHATE